MARVRKEFITDRLNDLYDKKWRSQGKTQKEFAEAIKEVDPASGINETYVSRLLNGKYAPKQYLPAICQVLDVDISEFSPKTHDDRYQYASDFADGLEGRLEELAINNFKIDLTFFQGLKNIIPDFDDVFPKFYPLFWYDVFDQNHKPFQRIVPAETTETSSGQGLFQITRDGKTYFLTKYDMKFILWLQLKIRKYVLALFEAHQKTLDEAEARVDTVFWEKNLEVNPEFDKDNTFWTVYKLSEEELQDIDQFGIYTEKEERRFRLPRVGTPLYDDNTETEG